MGSTYLPRPLEGGEREVRKRWEAKDRRRLHSLSPPLLLSARLAAFEEEEEEEDEEEEEEEEEEDEEDSPKTAETLDFPHFLGFPIHTRALGGCDGIKVLVKIRRYIFHFSLFMTCGRYFQGTYSTI